MEENNDFTTQRSSVVIISIITSISVFIILILSIWLLMFMKGYPMHDYMGDDDMMFVDKNKVIVNDVVSEESRVVEIVEESNDAVVSIVVTKDIPVIEQYYEYFDPFGSPFGGSLSPFRFKVPRQRQKGTEEKEIGGGSGFFVSSDGFIVTNRHVVADDEAQYTVLTNSGEKLKAEVLAKDSVLDIAVLRVEGDDFEYVSFGDSDALKPGQTVIAIGNALAEFRNSVSVGVVSGLSRSIMAGGGFGESELLEGVIQTDAAINPGNSGGPLFNLAGQVIGVNVAMARGSENIGFALPSNAVKNVVESVQEYGEIVRPYLGLRYIPVTKGLAKKNNLSVDYGALVTRGETIEDLAVMPGSPADKAGIMENDIILEIDGEKVGEEESLASIIRKKQVGDTVTLLLLRKGEEVSVKVKLEKSPSDF